MAAQTVRDTVDMEQILGLYGYQTKRGFMVCPFHGDKDASLKVYKGTGGWHCFGCGKGGSVIDFVMEHEGCDFRTAVIAIDKALGLHLQDPHEDAFEAEMEKQRQKWLDDYVFAVYGYCDALKEQVQAELRRDLARVKECEMIVSLAKEKNEPPQLTPADYNFMDQWREISLFNEYRIEKIDSLREEVAAWRRKLRRAMSASSQKK